MAKRQPYLAADGERVPGVTTITGRYHESGALVWWANAVGRGEHESCEDQDRCPVCKRRPGRTQKEASSMAADVGTYAHALVDNHVMGTEVPREDYEWLSQEQTDQASLCLDAFKRWVDNFGVTFLETELRLVSEEYRFGGMLDSVGRLGNGTLVLPDWKTSKGIYADYLAQIAAYGILVDESELFGPVEEYHILRISKTTAAFHHHSWPAEHFKPARDWFLKARELYEMEKPMKDLLK